MALVVAERTMPEPLTVDLARRNIRSGGGCNQLYGITHLGSLLGPDGRQAVCFYHAPDAEAVRSSSRRQQVPYDRLWSATLHGPDGVDEVVTRIPPPADGAAVVQVSRSFAAPTRFDELQAQADVWAWCLQAYRVRFLQSVLSFDKRRMLCFYAAPDAEAVRHAQRRAGLPFEQAMPMTIVAVPADQLSAQARKAGRKQ